MKTIRRKYALISGISLLTMAVAAGYAYGFVHGTLIMPDDPEATVTNLREETGLFGSGILAWLIILICDFLVAWNLYQYFKPIHGKISAITGIIRGLYSVILAYAIVQLISAWYQSSFDEPNANMIMGLVQDFETYWSNGLIVFGLHLVGLGYLSLRSNALPKWMGWLLYLAGISYTIINSAKALVPEVTQAIISVEMVLSAPMAIAELGLAIWLIWKGGKEQLN